MKNRIRELRRRVNLTQSDFGAKIGVKGNTITNYETGLRNPSDAIINSICREFDVNEQWLRTGEGEMLIARTRDEEIMAFMGSVMKGEASTFQKRLLTVLARLSVKEWELIEKKIKELAEEPEGRE